MTIHVTEADIRNGARAKCRGCPVALAVSRASGIEDVHVGPTTIRTGFRFWTTPKAAKEFIHRFDDGSPVEPFSFELAAVPDSETVTP